MFINTKYYSRVLKVKIILATFFSATLEAECKTIYKHHFGCSKAIKVVFMKKKKALKSIGPLYQTDSKDYRFRVGLKVPSYMKRGLIPIFAKKKKVLCGSYIKVSGTY